MLLFCFWPACAAGNLYGGIIANAFPIIGEGLGQTLRVIAVAPEGGAGCDAMLRFVDVSGNQQPPNPNKTVDLMPGQSDFLDFPANLVLTRLGQRLELRPTADVLAMLPSGAPANTDCMFFAEVFDQATGFSQVFAHPPNPNMPGSMPTFPLMGVALGQVLRFTAVAVGPGPQTTPVAAGACMVTMGFEDMSGVQKPPNPNTMTLSPGQGMFLDFSAAGMLTRVGQRAEVRPVAMISSPDSAMPCIGVVFLAEIFDTFSGHTWSAVGPGPAQ